MVPTKPGDFCKWDSPKSDYHGIIKSCMGFCDIYDVGLEWDIDIYIYIHFNMNGISSANIHKNNFRRRISMPRLWGWAHRGDSGQNFRWLSVFLFRIETWTLTSKNCAKSGFNHQTWSKMWSYISKIGFKPAKIGIQQERIGIEASRS